MINSNQTLNPQANIRCYAEICSNWREITNAQQMKKQFRIVFPLISHRSTKNQISNWFLIHRVPPLQCRKQKH